MPYRAERVLTMPNKPIHEIRMGHVKATIWANEGKAGPRHGIKMSRIYKDGNKWCTTETFSRDDLPLLAKVADSAHTWIYAQAQEHTKRPENDQSRSSKGMEMTA